jgi:hypothetical protein
VVCSDLGRALPLLRHNARLNGGQPPATQAAAVPDGGSGGSGCGRVLSPLLHELSEQVPAHADNVLTYSLA